MKIIICLLLAFFSLNLWSSEDFKSPDILIESKLDRDLSKLIVAKVRKLLSNYGIDDPFSSTITDTIYINNLLSGLSQESKDLLNDLGKVVGLNFLHAQSQIAIEGLTYDVEDFKINELSSDQNKDDILLGATVSASELNLTASKLRLTLSIPVGNGQNQPVLAIDIINPKIIAREDKLINFYGQVKLIDKQTHFGFEVVNTNFQRMAQSLISGQEKIELSYDEIVIPEFKIKVGSREIDFSPEKIRQMLRNRHEAIKSLLLTQASFGVENGLATSLLKLIERVRMPKEYWLSSSLIRSKFQFSKISASSMDNNLELNVPAEFCTLQTYTKFNNNCVDHKETRIGNSRITEYLHQDSLLNIQSLLESDNAAFIVSVSEDYLNKLITTTYDAGLWNQAMEESRVELGPSKVFLRLDEESETGTLVMDVVYKATKMERIFIGSRKVHFPLALKVAFKIVKKGEKPNAVVTLRDVDLTNETLLKGRPEFGIMSNISDLNMQKKIIAGIRESLLKLKNKEILSLEFPEFRGLGFEKIQFLSDGKGRMNAILRHQDIHQEPK
ncbi:MAG: hypothetical protein AB7I27_16500 [Bacteriovoracaceae bacterium]